MYNLKNHTLMSIEDALGMRFVGTFNQSSKLTVAERLHAMVAFYEHIHNRLKAEGVADVHGDVPVNDHQMAMQFSTHSTPVVCTWNGYCKV